MLQVFCRQAGTTFLFFSPGNRRSAAGHLSSIRARYLVHTSRLFFIFFRFFHRKKENCVFFAKNEESGGWSLHTESGFEFPTFFLPSFVTWCTLHVYSSYFSGFSSKRKKTVFFCKTRNLVVGALMWNPDSNPQPFPSLPSSPPPSL